MPIKQLIPFSSGTFFITFTCYKWIPLIEKVNGYEIVYNWFDHLKHSGHYINGYVVMPNHVHALISFVRCKQNINIIVGNGKRFMAYEIVKKLKKQKADNIIASLSVERISQNNKKHHVWQPSFDWKYCESTYFSEQKLDYIHDNPCSGKWNLSDSPAGYCHSSAKYYLDGIQAAYPVTNIMEMEDVEFE